MNTQHVVKHRLATRAVAIMVALSCVAAVCITTLVKPQSALAYTGPFCSGVLLWEPPGTPNTCRSSYTTDYRRSINTGSVSDAAVSEAEDNGWVIGVSCTTAGCTANTGYDPYGDGNGYSYSGNPGLWITDTYYGYQYV